MTDSVRPLETQPGSQPSLPLPSLISGVAVPVLSMLVLVGWLLDVDFLKRVIPSSVAMNPMTAVCFLLVTVGLWLSFPARDSADLRKRKLLGATACALTVGAIASIRLLGYALGWEANVDRLLFADQLGTTEVELSNRMAPNTALNFVLASSALLFLDASQRRWLILSQATTLL